MSSSLADAVADLSQRQAEFALMAKQKAALEIRLVECEAEAAEWAEAQVGVQAISQAIQLSVVGQIEDLTTHALQAIFGPEYAFRVALEEKRGRTEAAFLVVHEGQELDPLTSCGGGVVDIVSFALRLASIVMDPSRNRRRLLVLDEPFKFLNVARRPAAAELLQSLCERLGFQLIIISHDPEFTLGTVYELG